MLDNGGDRREDLEAAKADLTAEIKALATELAAYSDNDPTELERKRVEVQGLRTEAEQYTDEIESMEGWIKAQGQDSEGMKGMRQSLYGDEYDEEEGVLKELP